MKKSTQGYIIRIFHVLPGGIKQYHTGPLCLLDTDPSNAEHYVCENPLNQVEVIRANFELACKQNRNFTHYSLDNIQTTCEEVPQDNIRNEDRLTFKRRFCLPAA